MLVLTRKCDEKIFIEHPLGPIEILVCKIQPGEVRLGFRCHREIVIQREEVAQSIARGERK